MKHLSAVAGIVSLLIVTGRCEAAGAWRAFPLAPGIERGQQVYMDFCEICHGAGVGKPGTDALEAKYRGALPAVLVERTDLGAATIREVVRRGISMMPFYRKTELSDDELAALAEFLCCSNVNRKQIPRSSHQ